MTRLIHITTVPQSLIFIDKQMAFMADHGFEVEIVSSPGEALDAFGDKHGIKTHGVAMERAITPGRDLVAITQLTRLLKQRAPHIVHAHTPKGGMLGMAAATAASTPIRIYHMRGLLTLTAKGRRHALLAAAETTSCELADVVICQSQSLRRHAVDTNLVDPAKAVVLGDGSNGVDADYFHAERWRRQGHEIRQELGIPAEAVVIGFVGRLVGDKGIEELALAWSRLRGRFPDAHLLLVGPYEERDPVNDVTRGILDACDRVHMPGFVKETAPYYAAMDLLTLPSYREGFPNAPLEAAAMGLPVVATHVVGCRDAVENRKTGILIRARDAYDLEFALARYLAFPALRTMHGDAGRARVLDKFTPERINRELLALYEFEIRRRA